MWFHRVNTLCYICFIQKWLLYVVPSSQYIMIYLFHTEVVVICGSIESIHYAIFVLDRKLSYVVPSSQYIVLYLFCTEVVVLCGSIKSIHYDIFVSYRSGCHKWFHQVNTLCYICFIQKWLSYVVPSSQYIMIYLFHTEVVVICGSIESIHYDIFVSYRSGCHMWFHRVNTL